MMQNNGLLVIDTSGKIRRSRYKIGDMFSYWIVFFVDHTGQHGLMTDYVDAYQGAQWSPGSVAPINTHGDALYIVAK